MPEKSDDRQNFDPLIQPFREFWANWLEGASEATKAVLETSLSQVENQTLRRQSFDEISKSLDDYLRSPEFLQAMKQRIDEIIQAKQIDNDFAVDKNNEGAS